MMGVIQKTAIPGLLIIERPTVSDERGFFHEVFRLKEVEQAIGFSFTPVQWNHSKSETGVIRALHAENWNKLVYPVSGKMFAALVDIRHDSKTFGKVLTFTFDETKQQALFIPKGVANSICAIEGSVHCMYLVDAYYTGDHQPAIAWDDPDLKIKWPVKKPILSARDKQNPTMRELFPGKFS